MKLTSKETGFDDQSTQKDQRKDKSEDENDAWGDKLGKTFQEEILIGCANVGRLWIRPVTKGTKKKGGSQRRKKGIRRKGTKYDKNEELLQWINDNNFDVFRMCETGLNWDKLPPSRNLKAHIKRLNWKEQTTVICNHGNK